MKKILVLVMLVISLLLSNVVVADSTVWNVDYLQTRTLSPIFGDIDLVPVSGGQPEGMVYTDLTVTCVYDGTATIVNITSNPIEPEYNDGFVADTKVYHYVDNNALGNYYEIHVDYSGFVVPAWWALYIEIEDLNTSVGILELEIANLTENNTQLLAQVGLLNSTVANLTENVSYWKTNASEWKDAYNATKSLYDALLIEYNTLQDQQATIDSLTADLSTRTSERDSIQSRYNTLNTNYYDLWNTFNETSYQVSQLQWEREDNNRTIDALANPITLTYPRDGINIIKFSLPCLVIGALCIVSFEYFVSKKKWPKVIGGKSKIIDPLKMMLPFAKKEKKEPIVWDVRDSTDDEKAIISDVKSDVKQEETKSADGDEVINISSQPETKDDVKPKVEKKSKKVPRKKKDTNIRNKEWWSTEAGLAQKEKLRERMKHMKSKKKA